MEIWKKFGPSEIILKDEINKGGLNAMHYHNSLNIV
jgi:hypothetical protein